MITEKELIRKALWFIISNMNQDVSFSEVFLKEFTAQEIMKLDELTDKYFLKKE